MIISVLMALLLLGGCAASSDADTAGEELVRAECVHFDDIEYIRPDMDETYTTMITLQEALENPFSFKDVSKCIDSFYAQHSNFETMFALMEIYRSRDVHSEFYDEEYSWLLETDAEFDLLYDDLYSSCADSFHAFWLERVYFWDGFREEFRSSDEEDDDSGVYYEDIMELKEREAELLAEYRRLAADRTVEIGGQEVLLDEYLNDANAYEYYDALETYYERMNPLLARVYIDLIEVRREYAELWGEEGYAAMEYEDTYGRDFDPDKAELFMDRVKYWMAPLRAEVNETERNFDVNYDTVSDHELMLYMETASAALGGYMEEAFDFMCEYGLYDFEFSQNKANSSFQIYLEDYEAPYLFLDPYGDSYDISTLAHEFGHYVDAYIRYNSYESKDLAEVFSQAMEFLFVDELGSVMSEDEIENLRLMVFLSSLNTFLYQTALQSLSILHTRWKSPAQKS